MATAMSSEHDSVPESGRLQILVLPDRIEEERSLVLGCREGDRESQHALYERYSPQVYRLMYRLVGTENADDLTQSVFLRVFRNIDRFEGKSTFSTWLYRVARNEALQFLRKQTRHPVLPLIDEPRGTQPSEQKRIEDRDEIEFALSNIDPDLRSIFLLREVEELSYRDIARVSNLTEGTVASRLNRARRLLAETLDDSTRD